MKTLKERLTEKLEDIIEDVNCEIENDFYDLKQSLVDEIENMSIYDSIPSMLWDAEVFGEIEELQSQFYEIEKINVEDVIEAVMEGIK